MPRAGGLFNFKHTATAYSILPEDCVCVRTRNYGATQRFHKLNIHSFMPERPHKRNCPEMTQYTFR